MDANPDGTTEAIDHLSSRLTKVEKELGELRRRVEKTESRARTKRIEIGPLASIPEVRPPAEVVPIKTGADYPHCDNLHKFARYDGQPDHIGTQFYPSAYWQLVDQDEDKLKEFLTWTHADQRDAIEEEARKRFPIIPDCIKDRVESHKRWFVYKSRVDKHPEGGYKPPMCQYLALETSLDYKCDPSTLAARMTRVRDWQAKERGFFDVLKPFTVGDVRRTALILKELHIVKLHYSETGKRLIAVSLAIEPE